MLESVDRHVWGACVKWRVSSSLISRTKGRWLRSAAFCYAQKAWSEQSAHTVMHITHQVCEWYVTCKDTGVPTEFKLLHSTLSPYKNFLMKEIYTLHSLLSKAYANAGFRPGKSLFFCHTAGHSAKKLNTFTKTEQICFYFWVLKISYIFHILCSDMSLSHCAIWTIVKKETI